MQRFTSRGLFVISVLAVALMLITAVAIIPTLRYQVRSWVVSSDREILAKTSGYVTPEGPFVFVFKIRENGSLKLEVYSNGDSAGESTLLQKIDLNEVRDGYVNFQGNATNLALADTDHDGAMDLIAPSFDDQMTPRLNVFRFNRALNSFERIVPPPQD
ncbi:MAG TPA: hypothetical protein PL182_06585 [Pseudobdellovibrionaceae bacterium]|nr:hypothetical protein [Pseudobdellovibrionaceae bacterium]